MTEQKFYGLYRGLVQNNADPMRRGRIMAIVPALNGAAPLPWAMPCVPFAAGPVDIVVPPVGANVWIQFEAGDLDHPVWVGGFLDSAAREKTEG